MASGKKYGAAYDFASPSARDHLFVVHRPDASDDYRAGVRRKLRAYHVHVQLGAIAQGLLQHLAINHTAEVWCGFWGWLCTMNPAMPPSELVVANALRTGLPAFFAVCDLVPGLKKIVDAYRRDDVPPEGLRIAV